jgi:sugar/nucleoside kinase (ribokinase family)
MQENTKQPEVLFLGRTTLDALYWLDRLPEEDTKCYAGKFHAAVGGPAANAALTHAMLGGQSYLITSLGQGMWADAARGEFRRHGVQVADLAKETAFETPLVTVLVSAENSSRTCINPPLHTACFPVLDAAWEKAVPETWGAMPAVALTDGFHLAETLPLLATLHEHGAAICLDGGSWKPGTEKLAPLLRTAICSERFQTPREFGGASGPEAVLQWFAAQGVREVAITRGPRSILGREAGRSFEIEIEAIDAADTLGAGDVLHGAWSFFRARGLNFEAALRKAAQVATESCKTLGIDGWNRKLQAETAQGLRC